MKKGDEAKDCAVYAARVTAGRAKKFISARGAEFEAKDLGCNFQALYELIDDLGGGQRPTVGAGERALFGFDPEGYAAALAARVK